MANLLVDLLDILEHDLGHALLDLFEQLGQLLLLVFGQLCETRLGGLCRLIAFLGRHGAVLGVKVFHALGRLAGSLVYLVLGIVVGRLFRLGGISSDTLIGIEGSG